MNEIEKARTKVNEQVARYVLAHPAETYEQVARTLGVSRWRVLSVAAGLGICRKTGPKPKPKPQITIR
jgi:hypothetical protein